MFEYEYELETALDREAECEFASEYESDQFLPLLAPVLASAAPAAIKAIGGLFRRRRRRKQGQREFEFEAPLGEYEGEFEDEYVSEFEDEYEGDPFIGRLLMGLLSRRRKGKQGEFEFETALGEYGAGELEFEFEDEFESIPGASEYEVMMEHLAYQAAQSESEAEAEAFLGALVPLAARLIPSAAKAITAAAPSLVRGVASMGRALHRSPTTRKLLQTMPTVLKGTTKTLANQAAQGRPISGKTALRALAGNTAKVLSNPKKTQQALRACHRAQHRAKAIANGRKRRPAYA